ncbi:Mov34/MPN/PAD-1 family protein [Niallia sp. Sow4_A1]|uniref:Mov34/MPN/PAD-1 family protein n=1 Tax=Niallia sp. Sow4_A1 TaxID=3438793 RepID=UPI003F9DB6AF
MKEKVFTKMITVQYVPMKEWICIDSNNEEVYLLPDNRILYIRPEAIEKMFKYKQLRWTDKEAGGILIGRILEEDNNIIIDDVSEPMPTDKRKRTRFSRKPDGHQEYMNEAFEREKGCCFYLGEWHTHPQSIPVPSTIDRKDWKRLLKVEFESGCLFFVIVGTYELKVWYGDGEDTTVVELKRRV